VTFALALAVRQQRRPGPDQVADRLLGLGGHPDRGELAGPVQNRPTRCRTEPSSFHIRPITGTSSPGIRARPTLPVACFGADRAGPAAGLRTSLAMTQRHWANQTATPPEGAGTVTVAAGVAATVGVGFRFRVGSGSPSRSGLASGSCSRSRAGPTLVRTRPEMLVTITGSVLYAMHYSFPSRLCITMWPRCSP